MIKTLTGAVLALALALPLTALAQAPIVIKFSHVVAADTPKGKGALRFKELAEQRTAGRVRVEVYGNSTLYKDKEELEALQLGAVQMLAFNEVYQAMQTGVVDGSENTPSNIYTQKVHEVQKYLTVSNHGYIGYSVIVNAKFWAALPPDVRSALEGAMRDATRYTNAIAQQENDDALAAIKASGKIQVIALDDRQRAAWHKALEPVYKEMEPRVGTETIAGIRKEAAALGYK